MSYSFLGCRPGFSIKAKLSLVVYCFGFIIMLMLMVFKSQMTRLTVIYDICLPGRMKSESTILSLALVSVNAHGDFLIGTHSKLNIYLNPSFRPLSNILLG